MLFKEVGIILNLSVCIKNLEKNLVFKTFRLFCEMFLQTVMDHLIWK